MKTTLTLGPGLELPLSAVTQKLAFIAISGAGKTYTATKLAEEMWRAACQFVVIDPVGVWYGLRLQEDGKTKSDIDIPVFGGLHGDIPIEAEHGAMLAGLVATKGLRCILDVSIMRKGDRKRFVTSFCEELFHLKKTHRGPLHVFFEEAQFFAPQMSGEGKGEIADLIGAMQDLCCVGRNFGIGHSLITQRPQSVQKSILNQSQALFVFQTSGSQERKAISEWASECGIKAENVNLDLLPALKTGEAVLWSPKWLERMDKVVISKKTTYDASSTPEYTQQVELQPIDLLALGEEMKQVVADAEAHDPKKLIAEVKELRKKLLEIEQCKYDGKPTGLVHKALHDQAIEELDLTRKEVTRLRRVVQARAERSLEAFRKLENLELVAGGVAREVGELKVAVEAMTYTDTQTAIEGQSAKDPAMTQFVEHVDQIFDEPKTTPEKVGAAYERGKNWSEPHKVSEPTKIVGGGRRMLGALCRHPDGIDKSQLRMLAGLKKGGTFDTYMSALRQAGYMEQDGELFRPTAQGMRAVRGMPDIEATRPKSIDELLDGWKKKITGSGKKMFDLIVARGKKGITREELALKAPVSQGGTFDTYMSQIRRTGCFEFGKGPKGVIKIRDDLHTLCAS